MQIFMALVHFFSSLMITNVDLSNLSNLMLSM